MKIKYKYVIGDIEWEEGNSDLPNYIELPYFDQKLDETSFNYRKFLRVVEKSWENYMGDLYECGVEYLEDVYSNEIEGLYVYKDFDVEIEESDVLEYINNLPEDKLDDFFNKLS